MDSDQSQLKPRVVKFKPKAPPRVKRKSKIAKPKEEEIDDADAQQLLQKEFYKSEALRKQKAKVEDHAIKPTFTYGAKQPTQFTALRFPRYGGPNDDSDSDAEEYREPWEYNGSVYPTVLPWRRPYSGDPDILDEAEFGEAAIKSGYNENEINAASELGFLDLKKGSDNGRMLLFQLPPSLPLLKRDASAKGKEKEGTSASGSKKHSVLGELPGGHMGKLLVYKSGTVKLKLGDTLFDVSPGSDNSFAQEVAGINLEDKEIFTVRELPKKAVVTLDFGSILGNFGGRD